jgi:hypothetical protein
MKGMVTVVEIKCPKCGYVQTIEGGESVSFGFGAPRAPACKEDPESPAKTHKRKEIKR